MAIMSAPMWLPPIVSVFVRDIGVKLLFIPPPLFPWKVPDLVVLTQFQVVSQVNAAKSCNDSYINFCFVARLKKNTVIAKQYFISPKPENIG